MTKNSSEKEKVYLFIYTSKSQSVIDEIRAGTI